MAGFSVQIKGFPLPDGIGCGICYQCHRAGKDIAEFFPIMGTGRKGLSTLRDFHQHRLHVIFLGIGHNPPDGTALPFIFKEIRLMKDHLFLGGIVEKF